MTDRVVTDYIRKRLSIQNEQNWSQDGTLYHIHSYNSCSILQVGTEEGQDKITNTKSAFKACQKNAMIDCVEGSA